MVEVAYDESQMKGSELTGIAVRDTLLGGTVDAYFGAQGLQGPQGRVGYQGPKGNQGDRGPQGRQGYQGFQGGLGTSGLQGFQGTAGGAGASGLQGFQGFQGFQGRTGNQFAEATFGVDGQGTVVTTGDKAWVRVPFDGTVTGWEVTADQVGSCVVDVRKSTYAAFPTFASIAGSEKPTLAGQLKSQNLVLSTWTTALMAGDYLRVTVESASVVTKVTVSLAITRS